MLLTMLFILTLLYCGRAHAQLGMGAAIIFQDGNAKMIAPNGVLRYPDLKDVRTLSVDPTAGAGIPAEAGTIGMRKNTATGELWIKTGAADTAWTFFDFVGLNAKIGTLTNTKWCTSNGTAINCTSDEPVIVAGKSGGQTITGGTASGDDLTLRSTSNATKGYIYLDETTASTDKDTGALVVQGGVGVEGNIYSGANITGLGVYSRLVDISYDVDQNALLNMRTWGGGVPLIELTHRGGTIAVPTATQSGYLAGLEFLGYKDTAAGLGGRLLFEADGNWSDSSTGSKLKVQLVPTGSTTIGTTFELSGTVATFNTGIRLLESTGATYYTTIQAANLGADYALTLPTTDGNSGEFLQTDGTGVLSWVAEADPQVGTLTTSKWCTTDGSAVNCATDAPVLSEVDPQVGTLTNTKWCTTDGSTITCSTDYPLAIGKAVTSGTDGNVLTVDASGNLAQNPSQHYNWIINGGMYYAQRGTSFVSPLNGAYNVDRFRSGIGGAGDRTVTQDTDIPSVLGLVKSLKLDVTTVDTSIGATDFQNISYFMSGVDFVNLLGKTVTFSFYMKSDRKTGNLCVSLRNDANDRSYITKFAVAGNTWTRYSKTIYLDPTGTWLTTTGGIGIKIGFNFLVGTDYDDGTDGSWVGSNEYGDASCDNFFDHVDNNIWITGVQLTEGSQLLPFQARYDDRNLIKKFYWTDCNAMRLIPVSQTASALYFWVVNPTPMIKSPSCSISGSASTDYEIFTFANADQNFTGNTVKTGTSTQCQFQLDKTSHGLTTNEEYLVLLTDSGCFIGDAEL